MASAPREAGAARSAETAPDPYMSGEPVKARSIGHTSYVLKLTLEGGAVAVFKPRSKRPLGDRRYKGEIAAYRLAVALGLGNVPRTIPRSFDAARMRAVEEGFDGNGLVDPDGRVRGALTPWIDGYRVLPLEEDAWRKRWEPWVTDPLAAVPDEQRPLAGAIATALVFDYVTGNWDRWSGGNVAQDDATGTVLLVDNDGAFYESPPPAALAHQLSRLRRVVRFPRGLSSALRALDEAKLRAAFGEESPGVPLLSDAVIAGVEGRRATAVGVIDARVADAGEQATYAFE
ncbi:MAG TPA: hypothetical protein VIF15_07330 [Polyangiaceae bacterium]